MMKRKEMKGYIMPILTTFDKSGKIDEKAMRESISYLINEGLHGIALSGSFGEFPLLCFSERERLFELAVDEAAGRCIVVAGTMYANTEEVVKLSQSAEKIGVDGLLIIPPYYLLPSPLDIKNHFRHIDQNVSIQIAVYNNPAKTGINLSPSLMVELSELEHVVTIKQSSTFFFELMEIVRRTQGRKDFHVTNGQEMWAFPALMMGAQAVYGISPFLIGRECVELYSCAMEGNVARGREIQYKISQIRLAISACEATPAAALRELANMRGLNAGYSRTPIAELSDKDKAILKEMSKAIGIENIG
jgi:4-hydroxy-tetrahydrodipicolinate synthase